MDNAVATLGYTAEGMTKYLYHTQMCGSVSLCSPYNLTVFDHFYTTGTAERDHGLVVFGCADEGIAGYILSN
ncbi:hypothetical protein AN958_02160 [Leucoagaricus sp. SymC.cos]|nr:hypothetical protein AN958_02160 [Leucoagaricus sp. SymC.cos]